MGIKRLHKFGEELCGDIVEIYQDDARLLLALSDGLGSGVKANILATLTCKIIITMTKEGMALSEVIDTVGKTLPICQQRNVGYATFSLIEIDKINDKASLIEFDNPTAIMLREGEIKDFKSQEENINGHQVKKSSFNLEQDDVIVLLSDGVIHAGIGAKLKLGWSQTEVANYIVKVLNVDHKLTMTELASWLIKVCDNFYEGSPGDDTTVVALRAKPCQKVTILVGPPKERKKDREVTKLLVAGVGKKIVCGGTTSQLVARELGESLQVDFNDLNKKSKIPPGGFIEGIDLVTEGVLTLERVYNILADKEELTSESSKIVRNFIQLLLQSDEISFLVGQAINPVYQNPNLPLTVGVKEQLIEKISNLLQAQGKKINIDYF